MKGIRTIPETPVCNMFHAYFDASKETTERIFTDIIERYNLCVVGNIRAIDQSSCKSELTFGDSFCLIPEELLEDALNHLESEL
jgi:hypothetical protein